MQIQTIKERTFDGDTEVYNALEAEAGDYVCTCGTIVLADRRSDLTFICEFCGEVFCIHCIDQDLYGTGWNVCRCCQANGTMARKLIQDIQDRDDLIDDLKRTIANMLYSFRKVRIFLERSFVASKQGRQAIAGWFHGIASGHASWYYPLKNKLRIALVMAVLLGSSALAAPSERLLDAIRQVESSGGLYNVGDGGKAVGPYQLWQIYVDDVNRIAGTHYTYADRSDEAKSRQMVRIYLGHYGKGKSQLDQARIHNGGPKGHKKAATIKYAEKIKQFLKGE